jgi:hypothetical protein
VEEDAYMHGIKIDARSLQCLNLIFNVTVIESSHHDEDRTFARATGPMIFQFMHGRISTHGWMENQNI